MGLTFSPVTQGIDQACLFSVMLGPEAPDGTVYTLGLWDIFLGGNGMLFDLVYRWAGRNRWTCDSVPWCVVDGATKPALWYMGSEYPPFLVMRVSRRLPCVVTR